MSKIEQALASKAALDYYAAAECLHDKNVGPEYQKAAYSACMVVTKAFCDTLEELGGFAKQVETSEQLLFRVACELIHRSPRKSLGTHDDYELEQFLIAIREVEQRASVEASKQGYDF